MPKHKLLTSAAAVGAAASPPGRATLRALRRRRNRHQNDRTHHVGAGRLPKTVAVAATAAVASVAATPAGRRTLRRLRHEADQKSRYVAGRVEGLRYRLRGGGPDPDVPDLVLADRVRSTLGPLERELDIPRVHVMVVEKVALLHGDVDTAENAEKVEQAVERVPGVQAVQSYLHIGLSAGDTRPSEGRSHQPPSELLSRLTSAARGAGVAENDTRRVVRTVLSVLADRLPPGERDHLFSHLAADVKAMLRPPRRRGQVERIRSAKEFVARVAADAGLPADQAQRATSAVFAVLREAAPEEVDDVAAVLPEQLRELWEAAGQTAAT